MIAQFAIALLAILAVGPLENEGGRKAVEAKGVKAAAEAAIEQADGSKLVGNYGND